MARKKREVSTSSSATPPDVGSIINRMRRSHGLSLDQVAAGSGVSKSMLSKIERNQTNPTLGTIWRLARAFNVTIEQIIGGAEGHASHTKLVKGFETPTLKSSDGGCTLRILGPIELVGVVEWYELVAEPHSALASEPHDAGAVEHLTVLNGHFRVQSGDEMIDVNAGETARYPGDAMHIIQNNHGKVARAIIVVIYRKLDPF